MWHDVAARNLTSLQANLIYQSKGGFFDAAFAEHMHLKPPASCCQSVPMNTREYVEHDSAGALISGPPAEHRALRRAARAPRYAALLQREDSWPAGGLSGMRKV